MQSISTPGLDTAKSVFQVHGVDAAGQVVLRRQLKRPYALAFFPEADAMPKKAQRQNPSFLVSYRCLPSAFAHLGRDAGAREATARLLEVDPKFTIASWVAWGGKSNSKLLIEGLRKAGLPE
jgi:hypothetical protein